MNTLIKFLFLNIIIACVLSLIMGLYKGKKSKPIVILLITNGISLLGVLFYWLASTNQLVLYPHIIRITAPFLYLLGPLNFLFIRYLLENKKSFKKLDWLHFLPFILHSFELMPFYLGDVSVKIKMAEAIQNNYNVPLIKYDEGLVNSKWHTLFKIISWSVYYIASFKIYINLKKKINTRIVIDYKKLFNLSWFVLLTKLIGFVVIVFAITFIVDNEYFLFAIILGNTIQISNLFLLLFKYPELIYGEHLNLQNNENRENLIRTVMSQSNNIQLLQESMYESNIILNDKYELKYFNKKAKEQIFNIYGKRLVIDEDFRKFLDEKSKVIFINSSKKCLRGGTVRIEERFFFEKENNFNWLQINIKGHFNENGKFLGISIGITCIDIIKKIEILKKNYANNLDEIAWKSSHILRAPIANMMGILNIMSEEEIQISDEEKNELYKNLSEELVKLDQVVKEMVKHARYSIEN